MSKKDSNFFEEHIEKIILAVVGLGCLWLFITRVLFSPNYIEYDNDKFDSGAIDNYISKQAAVLENKLNRKPEPKQPYQPRVDDFIARFDSAISDINIGFGLPQPIISSKGISDNRVYRIPLIGEVNEVLVEHIRTVAYVPKERLVRKMFMAQIIVSQMILILLLWKRSLMFRDYIKGLMKVLPVSIFSRIGVTRALQNRFLHLCNYKDRSCFPMAVGAIGKPCLEAR